MTMASGVGSATGTDEELCTAEGATSGAATAVSLFSRHASAVKSNIMVSFVFICFLIIRRRRQQRRSPVYFLILCSAAPDHYYTEVVIALLPAGPADFEQVRSLIRGANNAPYPFDPVAREKLLGDGYKGLPDVTVAVEGDLLVGTSVTAGPFLRLLAVLPVWRRRGIGSILLRDAESKIRKSSDKAIVAAEPGNYFTPGIYAEDAASLAFFRSHGYETTAEAVNLTSSLVDNPLLNGGGDLQDPSVVIRRATVAEMDDVIDYVRAEFGDIWGFEVLKSFQHRHPTIFTAMRDGKILAFGAHSANNAAFGAYGPAGTSKGSRGAGLGGALLKACLRDLLDYGHDRVLIQWAAAEAFYHRACGAELSERFSILQKRLS